MKDKFSHRQGITTGADLFSNEISCKGEQVIIQIWDTAGQEKFKSIGDAFYHDSNACMLVYDITQKSSFANIGKWKREFIEQGNIADEKSFPFIVVGTKSDLSVS
jgi:Ras-related protein Rab-7A